MGQKINCGPQRGTQLILVCHISEIMLRHNKIHDLTRILFDAIGFFPIEAIC